jgi:UDP-N-acetylglucosamine--N-acetylmuramyl-(pentapeptide) pyrophosphoryl-undecaprenol N-acetylglucosamine transferase
MKEKNIIISGGGTGGHIYPALAVGQKLQAKDANLHVIYVGSHRSIEKSIMASYRVRFISMKIEGIKGKGLKSLKSLFLLPFSFVKSLTILIRLRPDLVIGAGGYSSGPIVLLAAWLKIPTLILEQNFHPGFTNRLLLPWVRKAVVSFRDSLPFFRGKGVFIGNPVREEFYNLSAMPRNSKFNLLIFGGSQGSTFLNKAIASTLPPLQREKENLTIFHQTGEKDFEWVKKSYEKNGFSDIVVSPYFFDMANYFQKSDLVISRAGATTIAELIVTQKASLLIPFAKATGNHQTWNARQLEKVRGAEVILEKEFTPRILAERIIYFLRNKEKIREMEKNLAALKTDNVAGKIAHLCFELMEAKA